MLISFTTEINVTRKYENYGIQLVKGKEKLSILNNYEKDMYIELSSLVEVLGLSMNKFLDEIGYNPVLRGYLAHFREANRIFKVINVECLNLLFRNLASSGYDVDLLKTVKEQIKKALTQFEKEISGNGEN